MTDTIIGAFIGVGGAIIGATIAGPIAYCFSKKLITITHKNDIDLMQRQEFNKAAAAFRVAFVDVIYILRANVRDGTKPVTRVITTEVVDVQEKAKIIFEPFLSKEKLVGFNNAWEEYVECNHTHGKYGYTYSNDRTCDEDNKAHSQYCLEHIYYFFDNYAKPK